MAYVQSGDCFQLTAYYTQLGRQYLVTGDDDNSQVIVTQFALSDGDINYQTPIKPSNIPDVTGQIDGCINSIASAITLSSNIIHLV